MVRVVRDRHYAVIKDENDVRQTICLHFGKFVEVIENRNVFDIVRQKYTGKPSFYIHVRNPEARKAPFIPAEIPMLIEELTAANRFLEKSEPHWRKK